MNRVLVTAPGFDPDGSETGQRLTAAGLVVEQVAPRGDRSAEDMMRLAHDAVAAISTSDPYTAAVFDACPSLRIVARLGVGFDTVDVAAATRAGVVVTTTPGLNDDTCADHVLALMLASVRRIVENDAEVRRGGWSRGGALTPRDLHGKRVAVIGMGRIGRGVVRRLAGFGTEIRVFDPGAADHALAAPSLADVLPWADIVTLHAPLNPETAGMLGVAELALMKRGALVVNAARGGLVDERALLAELSSGRLAAALDVFAIEPPVEPLWSELPNVVLSPHLGGLSVEAIDRMARTCVAQVLDALAGTIPDGAINPDAMTRHARRSAHR